MLARKNLSTFVAITLLLAFTSLCLNVVAFRAPDEAPDLPDGWCDTRYGSPTRTTGECMCMSGECEGPRCNKEQGFVWYVYLQCPTCKCVPKKKKQKESQPVAPLSTAGLASSQHQEQQALGENRKPPSHYRKEEKETEPFNEADLLFYIMDTIEHYSRYMFVVFMCVFLLFVIYVGLKSLNGTEGVEKGVAAKLRIVPEEATSGADGASSERNHPADSIPDDGGAISLDSDTSSSPTSAAPVAPAASARVGYIDEDMSPPSFSNDRKKD